MTKARPWISDQVKERMTECDGTGAERQRDMLDEALTLLQKHEWSLETHTDRLACPECGGFEGPLGEGFALQEGWHIGHRDDCVWGTLLKGEDHGEK